MLSQNTLKELATKWQTSTLNVAREYAQNLFLSYLYQLPESDKLAFKGGTALRLAFRSPRFSEDLDFAGSLKPFHWEKLLSKTLENLKREALSWKVDESKPTSGDYLALYSSEIHGEIIRIELNISLRKSAQPEAVLIATPLVPPYQCLLLPVRDLVKEKIEALLFRKKPRDFYDLYFLLRERLGMEAIISHKSRLLEALESSHSKILQRELKAFLPISQHRIIANLPQVLLSELNRL